MRKYLDIIKKVGLFILQQILIPVSVGVLTAIILTQSGMGA